MSGAFVVVEFPIDKGVRDFQLQHDAVVSPAYGIWGPSR